MKIGVVGGGISGLGAALILSQQHEVHLFESAPKLGGHAHTVQVNDNGSIPMDIGFLVYNELTYPHLTAMFDYLQVPTVDSEMSLSIQVRQKNLEWCGTNLNSVFGQRLNLVRPNFYKMLFEILRFHREAEHNLALAKRHGWTLKDLFAERKFSAALSREYVLPMGAAIWSTPETGMLDYPADTFLTFFLNHRLLQVSQRPVWRTVAGGSIEYVRRIENRLPYVHLSSNVKQVRRLDQGVAIVTTSGSVTFDRVIMATHAPVTLALLSNASEREREILGSFAYQPNATVLHRDSSPMPKRKLCWSSWNVEAGNAGGVSLT
jgi:predicted NAD/FAD-binding protein